MLIGERDNQFIFLGSLLPRDFWTTDLLKRAAIPTTTPENVFQHQHHLSSGMLCKFLTYNPGFQEFRVRGFPDFPGLLLIQGKITNSGRHTKNFIQKKNSFPLKIFFLFSLLFALPFNMFFISISFCWYICHKNCSLIKFAVKPVLH